MSTSRKCKLAVSREAHLADLTVRAELPDWLKEENKERATRNQSHSRDYWLKIHWATPPWLNEKQLEEMDEIYDRRPDGYHTDHIVPLKHKDVCGLHVPWNLQNMPDKQNMRKSNAVWPDMANENLSLFDDGEYLYTPWHLLPGYQSEFNF